MALPADLAFKIKFDQTNSTPNFELEDTTDYTTLAVALADVRGNYTAVTDPLGNVIHSNTDYSAPDVVPSASLLYTGIAIPKDAQGAILEGVYSFTYNIKTDAPITGVSQVGKTFTIVGDYAALITAAGTITIVRSTGNNGTYTVVSAVFGGADTEIVVSEAVPSGTVDGSIQYSTQATFSKTSTVTYSNTIPAVAISVLVDCFCGNLQSIDATNYGTATIVSRTHTVKYPAALAIADIVSSIATVTVSPIYTKTWTTIITSTISIDLGGGNTISAVITGSKETDVDCDLTLCDISCCVLALNNRYKTLRTTNPTEAAKEFAKLNRMMQLIEMFQLFTTCSQETEANAIVAEIKEVGNCTDACQCSDEAPAIVVPLCTSGSNNINVVAGEGIVVAITLANGIYTYQVSLATSILNIINSVRPQSVLAGTGISIAYALVAGKDQWTVTNTAPYTAENRMEFLCRIQYTGPTTAAITLSAYLVSGANMNATATVASTTIATAALNNNFNVSAFQVANNNNYKVTGTVVNVTRKGNTIDLNSSKGNELSIINKLSGTFDFRFVNPDGSTITNGGMKSGTEMFVHIKISE